MGMDIVSDAALSDACVMLDNRYGGGVGTGLYTPEVTIRDFDTSLSKPMKN